MQDLSSAFIPPVNSGRRQADEQKTDEQATKYIEKFKGSVFILKYGGAALNDQESMQRNLQDVAQLFRAGILIVLVHGGGPMLSKKMKEKNIPVEFRNGLRVTSRKTMQILLEVFGDLNKKICQTLDGFLCPTQSIVFEPCIQADLINPEDTENRVGKIVSIETTKIDLTRLPVISSIATLKNANTHELVNINADSLSVELAHALGAQKIIFISDVNGILTDINDPSTMISHITETEIRQLVTENIIHGGMEYKVRMALEALKKGIGKVHFINGLKSNSLMLEILTEKGIGTEIVADQ